MEQEKTGDIFYGSATVGTKGQIVIPVKLREVFNIKAGDTLFFVGKPEQGGFAIMKPEGMLMLQSELEHIQQQISKMKGGK
ncbi:AbrB/MazE/SpoVT family DNA-binding domain-containing protein [Candidatus Acetothermia bacterium]|nr:AbrB/MazE/SpoVT family DNA-binding domain-containing protein [Candidatus Acetothermia bacterium]